MKAIQILGLCAVVALPVLLTGCGSDVGVQVQPMTAKDHVMPGTPEERIKAIQADTQISAVEKQRRIDYLKKKFHVQ